MNSFIKSKPSLYVFLAVIFFLLNGPQFIYAQEVPPAIRSQINAELQKRGLNESEVRTRLLQEGIDLEIIPPAELPNYQEYITNILDKMEAEKKAGASPEAKTGEPLLAKPEMIESKTVITETSKPLTIKDEAITNPAQQAPTTKEEAIAEASQRVIQASAEKEEGPVAIYGHSLFTDQTLDIFHTTDGALAPDSYILGAGDEIRITIFGASQTDMQLMINNEGYIQPTGMPKIFLQGISLLQARNLLYKRLSTSYTFRSDQFALTIATARTIMVNIFGETKITGGFTLSALNSAFNALSAAGGPTNIGTVRNIQLLRGNKRSTMDLYAFMNDPAIQYKFDLQQNDIIYVPVVQNLVTVVGAVKRPMQYEMLQDETLADLITYAGGVNVNVYPDFVQIQRYIDGEIRLQEYNLSEVLSGKTNVALQNGDIIRIKVIEKPIEQFVEISGSVYYPGRYDLQANPSLSTLLANAQFTVQARKDLIFVERTRPDETVEVLTVPWADLQASGNEFKLQKLDRIQVPLLASYRDVATIAVNGYVRVPFEKSFALGDRLSVKQALELAGGVKEDVYPIAYVLRENILNPKEKTYFRLELDISDDFALQPGDQLNVFDKKAFTDQATITVNGNVRAPFEQTFALGDKLTIKQALELAGGVKPSVYPIAYIFRSDLFNPGKTEYIRINLETADNFILQPGDQLNVFDNGLYLNVGEVQILGAVKNPREFTFDPSLTVRDLLTAAGGFTVGAAHNRVEIFRTKLSPTEKTKLELITVEVDSSYRLVSPENFSLQPYDKVIVRQTPGFTAERTVEISGEVNYPGAYILTSDQVHLSKLINMAGGLLESADAKGSRLFRTFNNRGYITLDIKQAIRNNGKIKFDPYLFNGDVINIIRRENTVTIWPTATRLTDYPGGLENNTLNVVFQGGKSARWYINNYAGGFAKRADKKSLTVLLKNNQIKRTSRFMGIYNYPQIETGSTINLQMKLPKEKKENNNEKTDWGQIWGTTLSAVTTALTVIVLAKQL